MNNLLSCYANRPLRRVQDDNARAKGVEMYYVGRVHVGCGVLQMGKAASFLTGCGHVRMRRGGSRVASGRLAQCSGARRRREVAVAAGAVVESCPPHVKHTRPSVDGISV